MYTLPRLLLSMQKGLIECINIGGSHTRYDLQYICNHNMFMFILIFNKPVNWSVYLLA